MMTISQFQNPIVPGFAPDPSVVLIDDTFFLANSSFHVFPGLPIYASRDLKEWSHIGNAINRPSQIDLEKATTDGLTLSPGIQLIAAQGLYAPTIRYHNGTFYLICTNCSSNSSNPLKPTTQNFYITTKDIWSNNWSDPIFFDFQGIDPSLFFDDDGKAYIQGSWRAGNVINPMCTIRQFEIDISTGEPVSEVKELWDGHLKDGDVEGPHLYKKYGYYYLLAAEGGTWEHHLISIARSKSVWGPFESYEKNPILTAEGTNEYIQNTGHGELFQDADDEWWMTCLGIRNEDGRSPMGRETFLTPVSWPAGSWPEIQHPRMRFDRPQILPTPSETDPFLKEKRPRVDDIYIRNADLSNYHFSPDGQIITLLVNDTSLSTPSGTTSFLGKRQRSLDSIAETTLSYDKNQEYKIAKAGLAVYKEDFRHTSIYYDFQTSKINFSIFNKLKGNGNPVITEHETAAFGSGVFQFRIVATARNYEFLYRQGSSEGEGEWKSVGFIDTKEMTACDFTGTIFGIFASAEEGYESCSITFEGFDVR